MGEGICLFSADTKIKPKIIPDKGRTNFHSRFPATTKSMPFRSIQFKCTEFISLFHLILIDFGKVLNSFSTVSGVLYARRLLRKS